jgi:hypothetical protein
VRVVYDESGGRSTAVIARRRAEAGVGEQARMAGEVPVHLLVVDDNLALMPLGRDRLRTDGLLVVHPCALLDALSALFEMAWASALPLRLDAIPQTGGQPPLLRNNTTRTILGLLSAGLTGPSAPRPASRPPCISAAATGQDEHTPGTAPAPPPARDRRHTPPPASSRPAWHRDEPRVGSVLPRNHHSAQME